LPCLTSGQLFLQTFIVIFDWKKVFNVQHLWTLVLQPFWNLEDNAYEVCRDHPVWFRKQLVKLLLGTAYGATTIGGTKSSPVDIAMHDLALGTTENESNHEDSASSQDKGDETHSGSNRDDTRDDSKDNG
jgi:hypothetical protein